MREFRVLMMTAALALSQLFACSSGPKIRADADPSVQMSSYKTFGFFPKVATDKSNYTTLLTTRLKDATRQQMLKRGYQEAPTPQLLINFNVNIADRVEVESTPGVGYAGVGYYGYRGGMYGSWAGYSEEIRTVQYKEGTLAIDMVDAAKKQLVWHGIAEGRINQAALDNLGPAIDKVVADIFQKLSAAPSAAAVDQSKHQPGATQ